MQSDFGHLVPFAQLAAVVVAAGGLVFTGWQFMRTRRTATLQQLLDFQSAIRERETALLDAVNGANADTAKSDQERQALVDLLDCLEVYAAAINGRLIAGVAREIVTDKLIDCAVEFQHAHSWNEIIESSITSHVTYSHFRRFLGAHRKEISRRSVAKVASGND